MPWVTKATPDLRGWVSGSTSDRRHRARGKVDRWGCWCPAHSLSPSNKEGRDKEQRGQLLLLGQKARGAGGRAGDRLGGLPPPWAPPGAGAAGQGRCSWQGVGDSLKVTLGDIRPPSSCHRQDGQLREKEGSWSASPSPHRVGDRSEKALSSHQALLSAVPPEMPIPTSSRGSPNSRTHLIPSPPQKGAEMVPPQTGTESLLLPGLPSLDAGVTPVG